MSSSGTEFAQSQPGVKVLVLLGSPFLYGMERSVIELFDKLRPEVEPHFVLTQTAFRQQLPILREIESRRLPHSFLPDKREWPRIGKPHSLRDACPRKSLFAEGRVRERRALCAESAGSLSLRAGSAVFADEAPESDPPFSRSFG